MVIILYFYNTNIGTMYNESNNKQTAKQYVFCKIGILDSKAGITQIVIIILLFSQLILFYPSVFIEALDSQE